MAATSTQPYFRTHKMTTRAMHGIHKPKKLHMVTKHPIPPILEPSSISQALNYPWWREAMSNELTALMRHNTWELVPAPQGVNLVGCRRIFRIKRKSDDYVDRFKARLVEKGYNQPPGLDYLETFSHVVKPATIRTVLSIAVMQGWSLRQMDVNNAFLHENLDEDVFMSQLPSFVNSTKPGFVCKLKKSIYGLKQVPRAWYSALKQALLDLGFTNSTSDTSLFIYRHDYIISYTLVYVDDLVLTSNNAAFLSHIISKLSNRFSIKDLRPLHFFMGIEVIATSAGLMISQHKYIRYLLALTNMDGAKDV